MSATSTVTSSDGTVIAAEQTGSGPSLVLVDPAAGFRGFGPLPPLVPRLAERFTVVSYDRRGRGGSTDTVPYAVGREVEDLQAVIEAAGGEAFVFGYSSGAVLCLHAATSGVAIEKLVLFEPTVDLKGFPADDTDLGTEISKLVAAGRRGDAVEHFMASIGVPSEMREGMREDPSWPALEALAHTLVYDTVVTSTLPTERLAKTSVPTLVLSSESSGDQLNGWARAVAEALPDGSHRAMRGDWHGVAPEDMTAALAEFLIGADDQE